MANRADEMFVTLEDTTETAGILIGITENFFWIPEHVKKYKNVSSNAYRWTYIKMKPKL